MKRKLYLLLTLAALMATGGLLGLASEPASEARAAAGGAGLSTNVGGTTEAAAAA